VDLRLSSAEPTDAERRAIDDVFAAHRAPHDRPGGDQRFPDSGHAARGRRHILLPALHAVMAEVGYLSSGALNHVARTLAVPPADIYGVATFYAMFATEPRAPYVAHVCDDVACGASGGEEIIARLTEELGHAGEGKEVSWVRSPCLGLCERAPAVMLQLAGQPDTSIAPAAAPDVQVALRVAADIGEAQTGDRAFDQHARERALGRDAAGSPGSNPVFGRRPSGLATMSPRFPF
jgi:NADH-quinone oxidoreductase subunit F